VVGVLLILSACAAQQGTATPSPTIVSPTASPSPSAPADPVAATLAACDDAPEPAGELVTLTIGANSSGFDTDLLEGPRHCEPFTIRFENADSGAPHNVSITLASSILAQVFAPGDPFVGPRTVTYDVPALPGGEYQFLCTAHPDTMRGTLIVASP
jgi:hypothetical protein